MSDLRLPVEFINNNAKMPEIVNLLNVIIFKTDIKGKWTKLMFLSRNK